MIDIHAHILPGLDDGSQDMESSLAMAEMAAESGVKTIVATPHCNIAGRFENYWGFGLAGEFRAFRDALTDAGIEITICSGMEIFGTPDVPKLLGEGKLITLADSRYPLIEFPFYDYGHQATEILHDVAAMGYRPIVAHPERYRFVQEDPTLLNHWVDMGCLLQVNKGSLKGRFGHTAEMLALGLLDRGFAAFVASDAHSPEARTTWMADIWEYLSEEFSEDMARLLLVEDPERLLSDLAIDMKEPEWF